MWAICIVSSPTYCFSCWHNSVIKGFSLFSLVIKRYFLNRSNEREKMGITFWSWWYTINSFLYTHWILHLVRFTIFCTDWKPKGFDRFAPVHHSFVSWDNSDTMLGSVRVSIGSIPNTTGNLGDCLLLDLKPVGVTRCNLCSFFVDFWIPAHALLWS